MGTRLEKLQREHQRHLRFWLIGSVAGCAVAYPILIAAKLMWGLPDHLTWWWIAWTPLLAYGAFVTAIWFTLRRELRAARQFDDLA